MDRKKFLQLSGSSALALCLTPNLLSSQSLFPSGLEDGKKITILHTNDQHSRIEPFDQNSGRNAGKGGFARRATLIEQIRKEEKNVLLLDSGDIFQGTPYFNLFGGELEFKLMSMMKYDATTMGNHEFDNGLDGFLKALPEAKFPFLCSNYDFSNTILDGRTQTHKVLERDGIRIGIFGLGIELEGLVGKKQYLETRYLDPVDIAQHYADYLRKDKGCHLIICLSHLGYDYGEENKISDLKLAATTSGIDLILGGHTHTFLEEPVERFNANNQKVLINQVGFAGLLLGRVDVTFDRKKKIKNLATNQLFIDAALDGLHV